jgi:hypothetical protein
MKTYTRFNNQALFDKAQSLCPFPIIKGEGFNHWTDAARYLEWLIMQGDEYAMNIDQDCFITDEAVLADLIRDFKVGGYTHAGISDGGCLSGRNNISWAVMNPFFNLFAAGRIRDKRNVTDFNPTWENIREFGFMPKWNQKASGKSRKPHFIPDYERSMWEPFNGFFNWLFEYGQPMWLHGDLHEDGVSTIIKYQGKPFALHTWYSREYGKDTYHHDRIDDRFEEAKRHG